MSSHATAESAPAGAEAEVGLTHAQIVTILIGLMTGMFLAALDQTIVATAIRTISDDLDGLSEQAWVTTAYLITSTIVTPLYGKLSDIYGRKRFFLAAITIFVFGSALCSLAGSMYQLAVFRAVQGLGAGGLFSLALAILGDIVPPRERARYQGFFLAVFGTSSVLGPVVGGFLAGQSSILGVSGWRWVFLVNVPLGLVAFLVVARTLHLRHRRLDHRIDWWGAAALTLGAVPLLLVAEQGRTWGWGSLDAIICYAIGLVGIIAFVVIETRMGDEALLPLHLFRNRTIGISSIISVVIGIGMFGGLAMLPLYLQIVRGATPTKAGLLMLPLTLGIMTGSVLAGQLISKFGRYRRFIRSGGLLLTVGLVLFSFLRYDTAMWKVTLPMVVFGLGLGFMMQPLMLAVQNSANPKDMGVATSSATFTRQIGGTLGTAVFLSILFSVVPAKLAAAFTTWVPTPDFQAALKDPQVMQDPVNQAFVKALQSGDRGGLNPLADSSFIQHLDPRLARPFLEGFSNSMNLVFLVGACVMFVGWLVTFLLPHVELKGEERPVAE